jgi:hypothetical protein
MHLNDIATMKVGDRIRATDDIDLDHYAYVQRGETGTVVAIEVEAGDNGPTVFIRLDKPHRGLRAPMTMKSGYSPDAMMSRRVSRRSEPSRGFGVTQLWFPALPRLRHSQG